MGLRAAIIRFLGGDYTPPEPPDELLTGLQEAVEALQDRVEQLEALPHQVELAELADKVSYRREQRHRRNGKGAPESVEVSFDRALGASRRGFIGE